MPDQIDAIRDELTAAIAAAETAKSKTTELALDLVRASERFDRLRRTRDRSLDREDTALRTTEREHAAALKASQEAAERVHLIQQRLVEAAPNPDDLLGLIPASDPVLFLPVKIQTRYKDVARGNYELLVRIYPDTIHSDTFEPELNEIEVQWGGNYWKRLAAAATEADRKAAWAELVGRFGRRRAPWVAISAEPKDDGHGNVTPPKASRTGTWTRAPRTRLLPDRWIALLYSGSSKRVEMGGAIPDSLATGPSPTAQDKASTNDPALPELDDDMRWMVEFAEAEKKGMGLRIALSASEAKIDRLVIVGVRASMDLTATTERMNELLIAHHYTDGLALIPPGTPTNNTSDRDAGYRSRDGVADTSYAVERGPALFTSGDRSDGDLMASAIGVGADVLAHVAGADGIAWQDAGAMNAALWPIWRYFLAQMMAETFTPEQIAAGYPQFVNGVRAAGPLVTLLAGNEPYGILPVTSLDDFEPATDLTHSGIREALVTAPRSTMQKSVIDFLKKLRTVWSNSLGGVPRIGRTGDPERDLAEVLGQSGLPSRYAANFFIGGDYWINLWWFLGFGNLGWDAFGQAARAMALAELAQVGVDWQPRLLDARFWGWVELNGPHVDSGAGSVDKETLSQRDPLNDNYITWLLGADIETIRNEVYSTAQPPNALLYLLLRHAALLALTTAAASVTGLPTAGRLRVRAAATAGGPSDWREPELIDIDPAERTARIWDLVAASASTGVVGTAGAVAEDVFREGQGAPTRTTGPLPHGPELDELRGVAAALKHLEKRPTAVLERVMEETLDLGSSRLDAWITSFATQRLGELRSHGVRGTRVGGYGWVLNLAPHPGRAPAEADPTSAPVVDPTNLGFVHAASIGQAATAAVLRAGYLAHSDSAENPLAINLSSRRVRLARSLLEGVRQGQPLGALLGYRFERGLHDAHDVNSSLELDKFIGPFRRLAPLTAGKRDPQDQGSVEAIAARNVVDGWQLAALRKAKKITFGRDPLPSASTDEQTAIEAELDALVDAVDALSDAVVAEGVHQAIQGNPARAGASLEAIATGEAPPPELDVVRTPRTGIGVTHRLMLVLSRAAAPAKIVGFPERAREDAEPELFAWTDALFGDQDKVVCEATFNWTDAAGVAHQEKLQPDIKLSDLKISPLDVLYISIPSEKQERTELDQRLATYALQNKPAGVPATARVDLDYGRRATAQPDELSFAELMEVARAARELLGGARAIDARDLRLPEEAGSTDPGFEVDDLRDRADRALTRLDTLIANLSPNSASKAGLRAAILATAVLGVEGAVPVSPVDDSVLDQEGTNAPELRALQAQAASIKKELEERRIRIGTLTVPGVGPSDGEQVEYELARLAVVLGRGVKILPRFKAEPAQATELAQSFAASTTLQDGDPHAAATWVERLALFRPAAARLEIVMLYGSALGKLGHDFQVGQLPYTANDRWVGLAAKSGRIPAGRLSMVVHGQAFNAGQSLAGVMIEEFVDVVPNDSATTGVSTHFDAPGAEPPQALLLAVHPKALSPAEGGRNWDLATFEKILLETLELADLRGVDLDALKNVGQFLPTAYFADNSGGDTVATNFLRNVVAVGTPG